VKDGVRELSRAVLAHVQLRLALFGLEMREAAGHGQRVVMAAMVVVVAGLLGYVAGWAVFVLWGARRWAEGDVVPMLAVMAGVHGLAALGALWWLVARARRRQFFTATRAEFAEDQKWLHPGNQNQ